MEIKTKKCRQCGKEFSHFISGQVRCVECIMQKEPEPATSNTDRMNATDFAEWFVYKWRNIQKRFKGVEK